ncbi:hypothetical protein WMF20_13470 [Sorangium sp. So ce834]|uniref:hypothetical protein n=1 Tax=Sorangium sp. So ce834 TaxID=3133321 RepID=UPI003F5D5AF1
MHSFLKVADIAVWVLFGLCLMLDLYSLFLSIRRIMGHRGPSPVAFVPLLGYVLRIVTLESRAPLRAAALCAGAAVIHVLLAFGVPALVRAFLRRRG